MTPRKARSKGWAGVALVSVLAACSGRSQSASSDSSAPPHIDPCSVLSQSDIRTALGAAPAAGKRDNMGLTDDCDWTLPNGADVHVTFFNPVGAAVMYTPQVSSRTPRDKTYESISGLGDQAVYRTDATPVISVSESVEVVKGKQHFDLHYVDATPKATGPSKDTMMSLARTVLGRVP